MLPLGGEDLCRVSDSPRPSAEGDRGPRVVSHSHIVDRRPLCKPRCLVDNGGIDSLSCIGLQVDGAHVPSVPVGSPAENSVGEERIGIVAVSRNEDVDISHKAKPQGQMVGSIASRHMYR